MPKDDARISQSNRKGRAGARAVGSYLSRVAKAAFEAHGFPGAAIVSEWPAIAGAEFATYTAPERLIWPRRQPSGMAEDQTGVPNSSLRQTGATLVLRVDGPRAIEVQHGAPRIIERVNTYFGYRAIAHLRIIQGPVSRNPIKKQRRRDDAPPDERGLERIEDDRLREALARLNAQVG